MGQYDRRYVSMGQYNRRHVSAECAGQTGADSGLQGQWRAPRLPRAVCGYVCGTSLRVFNCI
jgi:hypothetical protein